MCAKERERKEWRERKGGGRRKAEYPETDEHAAYVKPPAESARIIARVRACERARLCYTLCACKGARARALARDSVRGSVWVLPGIELHRVITTYHVNALAMVIARLEHSHAVNFEPSRALARVTWDGRFPDRPNSKTASNVCG